MRGARVVWWVVGVAVAVGVVVGALVVVREGGERAGVRVAPGTPAGPGTSVVTAVEPSAAPTTVGSVPPPGTAPPVSEAGLSVQSRLGFAGLGPVRLGMTVEEASRAAGLPLVWASGGLPCVFPTEDPGAVGLGEVSFRVDGGRIVGIMVKNPAIATEAGVTVGASREQMLAAYPSLRPTPGREDRYLEQLRIVDEGARSLDFTVITGVAPPPQITGWPAGRQVRTIVLWVGTDPWPGFCT